MRLTEAQPLGELYIEISRGPKCPRCSEDGFDDWHLLPGIKFGDGIVVSMTGSIRCPSCSRYFGITVYVDGEVHSMSRGRYGRAALAQSEDASRKRGE